MLGSIDGARLALPGAPAFERRCDSRRSWPRASRSRGTSITSPPAQAQGHFAAARPLLERALAICERRSAPNIPRPRQPQQSRRPASGPGRLRGRAAALRARAGDLRKALGPEHPETATSLSNFAGLLRRRATSRARGRSTSARWRSARRRSAPSIPTPRRASTISPPCLRTRATSRARGRFSSARWRSARRRSAPSIPTPRPASTTSPPASGPGRPRGRAAAV